MQPVPWMLRDPALASVWRVKFQPLLRVTWIFQCRVSLPAVVASPLQFGVMSHYVNNMLRATCASRQKLFARERGAFTELK